MRTADSGYPAITIYTEPYPRKGIYIPQTDGLSIPEQFASIVSDSKCGSSLPQSVCVGSSSSSSSSVCSDSQLFRLMRNDQPSVCVCVCVCVRVCYSTSERLTPRSHCIIDIRITSQKNRREGPDEKKRCLFSSSFPDIILDDS